MLPRLTVKDLDRVCKLYSPATGLSWECFNPRWILQLPEEFKVRLLDIIHLFEDKPEVVQMWISVVVFLPKPAGGVRPIGLLFFVLRLQSRLRQPVTAAWERNNRCVFLGSWHQDGREGRLDAQHPWWLLQGHRAQDGNGHG